MSCRFYPESTMDNNFFSFIFVIHNDISSRRPLRQGTSEEPAEQPGSAVSRHHSEQRSMREWIGLMSLCIDAVLHSYFKCTSQYSILIL